MEDSKITTIIAPGIREQITVTTVHHPNNSKTIYTKRRDLTKPSVWIEGFEYKFNSELISTVFVPPPGVEHADRRSTC